MMANFGLISARRTLRSWQAEAIYQLLADGLRIERVWTSASTAYDPSTSEVPIKTIVPPDTPFDEYNDKLSLFTNNGHQVPNFVICCLAIGQMPACDFDSPFGFWFWQIGLQAPGCDADLAVGELARGSKTLIGRLIAWYPKKNAGRVLCRGRFRIARHSLNLTRRWALSSCTGWPLRAWRELDSNPSQIYSFEPWTLSLPIAKASRSKGMRLMIALLKGILIKFFEEFFVEEKWTLGILDRPITTLLSKTSIADIRWVKELPRGDYLADPMSLPERGRWILSEYFNSRRGKGSIAAIDLQRTDHFKIVLNEDEHLSYPYLLTVDGDDYCIPEQSASGKVQLYRATEFPDGWERAAILLPDVAGVDCTVFRHHGLWWMLGADHRDQDTVKLFGWFAPQLEGPWHAHLLTPLKTDVCGARPAGRPFYHNGELYRPAQDCSTTYGGALVIHRIIELTPERFDEEMVARINPTAASRYSKGIHSVCAAGDRTVIDAKRHYVSLRKTKRALKKYWYEVRLAAKAGSRLGREAE